MKYNIYRWIEEYFFYNKTISQKILSFVLLPISFLYGLLALIKRKINPPKNTNIPIISIGNLSMGGNGKTPLCIAIAETINKPVAIILRGYKRKSTGLIQVSIKGKILCSTRDSGDEAMLIADKIKSANVIVSSNRIQAIELAKTQNIEYIILDDGFSKSHIEKYDILIQSKEHSIINTKVFPSGSYREFAFTKKYANKIAIEGEDFTKTTSTPILKDIQSTTLITSISKPHRLDESLPKNINKIYFSDHHLFNIEEIQSIIKKYNTKTLLMTNKDFIKIQDLNIKNIQIKLIQLQIKLSSTFTNELKSYLSDYQK